MKPQNFKFHSTNQFRNVVKNIKQSVQYKGYDEEKQEPILDKNAIAPKLSYIGTVKLHGTNASIVKEDDGTISFHSKNNLLGYVRNGEFELLSDNAEFAQSMWRRFPEVMDTLDKVERLVKGVYGDVKYPLKVSGEWCGQGVQKGVGISFLPKRSFFIFGVKNGETDQDNKQGWMSLEWLHGITDQESHESGIYCITDFPTYKIDIDFQNPEYSQNELVHLTEEVENCCPVSEVLDLKDSEGNPQLLGEGLVWTPLSEEYCWDTGNFFKTKGKKHSVSKVKSVAAVCPEKLESIQKFVEYAVTENRLEQGVQEVGLDQKTFGQYIGWINRDINKEEADTLEASNLSMKDVGKKISDIARTFYLDKLNNNL